MEENQLITALEKARKDYTENFMPRQEICISLSIKEIEDLLLSKDLDESLSIAWHFKIYLRQLMFASTAYMQKIGELENVLSQTHQQCHFYRGNGIKALWTSLALRYFKSTLSDYTLRQIFDGTSVYDEYCAQVAYEEYQKRVQHRQWQERNKK
jgi:hypothetical protein